MRKVWGGMLVACLFFAGCASVSTKAVNISDATFEDIIEVEEKDKSWLATATRNWGELYFNDEENVLEYASVDTGNFQGKFCFPVDKSVDMGVLGSYTIQKARGSFTSEVSDGLVRFRMTLKEIYEVDSDGVEKWRELSTDDFKVVDFKGYSKKNVKALKEYLDNVGGDM